MPIPQEGSKAPDFDLPASHGKNIALKDLKGKNVVVYFYPKDDTPGCTIEACGLRDSFKEIEKLNGNGRGYDAGDHWIRQQQPGGVELRRDCGLQRTD